MTTTITNFRKYLFRLADEALKGQSVEFLYKGVVFRVVPEKKKLKTDNLIGQTTLASGVDLELAGKQLSAEMESEWKKEWDGFERIP